MKLELDIRQYHVLSVHIFEAVKQQNKIRNGQKRRLWILILLERRGEMASHAKSIHKQGFENIVVVIQTQAINFYDS